ncbi:hypothetical protein [Halothiobacillus sp.]|uniref:hypothetical protein n=1 Tax=Halothiobacillus sp. TaxID=1891311 RepID=UPI002604D858|nr:hypothetical protein [Halothiobacillus sp.]
MATTGPVSQAVLSFATRLCVEDATLDRIKALQKAADRLGESIDQRFAAVDCERLEVEIRQYQLIFRPDQQAVIRNLRAEAMKAMTFLSDFSPRLVGSVLTGTADRQSKVTLHLFADTPESVMTFLLAKSIPFTESERRYHYRNGRQTRVPVLSFVAFDVPFDLVVFGLDDIKEAPVANSRGGLMTRASVTKVASLLSPSG